MPPFTKYILLVIAYIICVLASEPKQCFWYCFSIFSLGLREWIRRKWRVRGRETVPSFKTESPRVHLASEIAGNLWGGVGHQANTRVENTQIFLNLRCPPLPQPMNIWYPQPLWIKVGLPEMSPPRINS